jgi:hypothetical protein
VRRAATRTACDTEPMTDIPTIREPEDDEADLTDLPDRPADQHGSDDDPDHKPE